MGTQVTVQKLPHCDFCIVDGIRMPAKYDGKTYFGPWANMCQEHFDLNGIGLGTGRGQELILNG